MAIWRGSTLERTSVISTWDPKNGPGTEITYDGTETDVLNKAAELQGLGYSTKITKGAGSPVYKMVATIAAAIDGGVVPPPEEDSTSWELTPHSVEQGIFECGRPFIYGIPSNVKAAIEAKIKNPQNENLFLVPVDSLTDQALINKAFHVYALKQAGADGRQIFSVSLRRSMTVSREYNVNWSIEDVNYVLSNNYLISKVNVPLSIRGLMPATGTANETVVIDNLTTTLNYYFGWLEMHPTYQISGNDKYNLSQEWVWNKWLTGDGGYYDIKQ